MKLTTIVALGMLALGSCKDDRIVTRPVRTNNVLKDIRAWDYFQERFELPNFQEVKLADKNSTLGRVQRAYRWKPIASAIESKYNIPHGTLLAMAMQESYGNPLQPNSGNDGGIGLLHMQGTTAKELGLKILGHSNSDHDPQHGKELKKALEKCDYILECIAKKDERAHPVLNLDAAARYVVQGKEKLGSWDKGVMWYRGPGHAQRNTRTAQKYLRKVRQFKEAFNSEGVLSEARIDFNKRNKVSFEEYISAFHAVNQNWGLEVFGDKI